MSFPCTSCGACCRHVDGSPLTIWLNRGDGVCRHFDDNTARCGIYAERPPICRIDEMHERLAPHLDRPAYYRAVVSACNDLQALHGIPESKRIHLAGA